MFPATEGNQVDVLRNGDEIFPAMLEAISGAKHAIDFLTFVFWRAGVGTSFARRCPSERGRASEFASCWTRGGPPDRPRPHRHDAGRGRAGPFVRPLPRLQPTKMNHRTHRKVMIVDEEIGFTGGVGIADEWRGDARNEDEWRDTHFRVRGPAVDGLRAAFLDNWLETETELYDPAIDRFPSSPSPARR